MVVAVPFDVLEPEVLFFPADVRPELDRLRCRRLVLLRPPQARCDVGRVRAVVSHEYGPVVRVEGPSKPVREGH